MGTSLIFPAPKCKYTVGSLQPFFHSIPVTEEEYSAKKDSIKKIKRNIPALYIRTGTKSKYLMIYFHGNSDDIGRNYHPLLEYYQHFQFDILAPEYPGYGLYKGEISVSKMIRDAQHILNYAMREDGLNYPIENIIVVGRSLGTGVAVQLAARYPMLRGMVLISAFTSIRDVANSVAGSLSKIIIRDIFQSLEIIGEIVVPTLFIHGKKDEVISHTHSIKLYEQCGSENKKLELRESMDHNRCKVEKDIFEPIESFLVEKLLIKDLKSYPFKSLNLDELPREEDSIEIKRSRTTQTGIHKSPEGSLNDISETLPSSKFSAISKEIKSDSAI